MHSVASCDRKKPHVALQCYFFFPLRTQRALSANVLSYTNLLFLLSFSGSAGTMMLSILYVIFCEEIVNII